MTLSPLIFELYLAAGAFEIRQEMRKLLPSSTSDAYLEKFQRLHSSGREIVRV